MNGSSSKDAETFGFGGPPSNIPWDQFETNARLFGTTTSYQEEIYTTKLNRGVADYKKREKEAEKLASEITGASCRLFCPSKKIDVVIANIGESTSRRGAKSGLTGGCLQGRGGEVSASSGGFKKMISDDLCRYSGVQRASNAYVPPGARRGGIPPRPQGEHQAAGPKTNGTSPAARNGDPTVNAGAAVPMAKTPSHQIAIGQTPPPPRNTTEGVPAVDEPVKDGHPPATSQPANVTPGQAAAAAAGEKEVSRMPNLMIGC